MSEMVRKIPCIILAGGFGTRLQSVVQDVVKPMAPMGHKPFLHVLMDGLHKQGIDEFILALGHKAETAVEYFESVDLTYSVVYSFESEPLGTGGAMKNALTKTQSENVLVVNGDTYFDISIQQFIEDAINCQSEFFMALKTSSDLKRFGNVVLNNNQIIAFNSTSIQSEMQNAGVYYVNQNAFAHSAMEKSFSLEQNFFPKLIHQNRLQGKCYDGYFIDIGIPEDYALAKNKLSTFFVNNSWTLFLDRDGVINERIMGDYVKNQDEFHFSVGAISAITNFSKIFGRIVVVTNQQGIGKGLMTESNLLAVHRYMTDEISKKGGRIDAVYYAPQLATENSNMRKPKPGMAYQAQKDFPEIDFAKSVMIGDSDSDIEFGQSLGMITVKLNAPEPSQSKPTIIKNDLNHCMNLFEIKKEKDV